MDFTAYLVLHDRGEVYRGQSDRMIGEYDVELQVISDQ